MGLVSIIVPVYNAQATISRCVQSILAQDYSDIEIILVDDGSTDETGVLLDAMAKADERIRVVHKENGGVSKARNTGLNMAKGDYVGFVDGDDWTEKDMFAFLVSMMESEKADIAICGHYIETEKAQDAPKVCPPFYSGRRILAGGEAYEGALKSYGYKGYLFNKLFKSEFFSQDGYGIRMDESLHICEDLLCVCKCFYRAQKIVYDPRPLYHYVISNSSATNSKFSLRLATLIDASRKIADLTVQKVPALAGETQMLYMNNVAFIYILALHEKSAYVLPKQEIRRVRKNLRSYIFGKENTAKYKGLMIGLSISQSAVKAVWRAFKRRTKNNRG